MFSPKYFNSHYWCPNWWAPSGVQDNARFVQMADLDTAQEIPNMPQRVNYIEVQAQDKDVRYRKDGIAPTSTIGLILYAGDPPTRFAGSIQLLKFIEVSASAKLNVHFY